KQRNLIIDDYDEAISFLERVNYYRFSAYGLTLKQKGQKDIFKSGVTFKQMKEIYQFDKRLRETLLYYLESIEIEFLSKIAYYHAHKFGSLGYNNPDYFTSHRFLSDILLLLIKENDNT